MSTTNKFDSDKIDLRSCVPSCDLKDIHPDLLELLRRAQYYAGFTFTVTSAFRTKSWEFSRGRNGSSSHTKGLALDISTIDSHTRFRVVAAFVFVGVPRIGIGKNFVHVDIDETKPHPVMWHYYE